MYNDSTFLVSKNTTNIKLNVILLLQNFTLFIEAVNLLTKGKRA